MSQKTFLHTPQNETLRGGHGVRSLKLRTSAAKILFAAFPGDGHFNPMTGLAVHLKQQGYDVRFYTSVQYREKVEKMGLPFFPFVEALELDTDKIDELFPDREKQTSQIGKLNHDVVNVFIKQGPAYYKDLQAVRQTFPFDLLIADVLFTGIPFVTDLMRIPVIGVGVVPVTANSKDLPPAGMGATPSYNFFGKQKQALMRWAAKHILFAKSNKAMKEVLGSFGIACRADSIFDLMPAKCDLILQTGTPGFEYSRSDLSPRYKFVGPLLPHTVKNAAAPWSHPKLAQYKRVVLVTQGTVEKDNTKLLVPALEALSDTDFLVIATTGGSNTQQLRAQYTAANVVIEDFIPFADVMPRADVYLTNGGMGGVQLSIQNGLPMVTAGVHEGKNEICARVGYFNLGINLKTERPSPEQVRRAVEQVAGSDLYRKNVAALKREFSRYDTARLCTQYVQELLPQQTQERYVLEEAIY